ncbi:MOSC domain-containing protein [Kribbella deserti]|uniref:MOSC domain-containing protein n=1 Tax=Kribbella deserti TaxID=1926257 RepID=A0ABV6QLZ9_9ACTN
MSASVEAVCRDGRHRFSKAPVEEIQLIAGYGVEGDAHAGAEVQHLFLRRKDPAQPNLRQVHLIHAELYDGLAHAGHAVAPGELGENVVTRGIDLLGLPRGTILQIGPSVRLEVTGLRNPCGQIDAFQPGLLKQVLTRAANGRVIRKSGIMSIVLTGGPLRPGDPITAITPPEPHEPLAPV